MADITPAGGRGRGMSARRQSRIVLISGSSLCHNPRVLKEATALAASGYDVHVLGAWLEPELKARDQRIISQAAFRFVPVYDCTLVGFQTAATRTLQRIRRKVANSTHALTGLESRHQLGFGIESLRRRALALAADLFIAHSESALYVAWRLMQDGRRVGVDMEDWFSEDLLPQARKQRPLRLLRMLESELLARAAYASCPSRAMSEALAAAYSCRPPAVVYNAFPLVDRRSIDGLRKDRRDTGVPSICWYSQTVGPGRGLEDLVAALALLDRDVEIHLRGRAAAGFQGWMMSSIPERWRTRIFFHSLVSNDELLSRVAEHDIGFAGEVPFCRSRDTTVTNKILHYLLGGLAVLASDTAGQREIAIQAPGAVELYQAGTPHSLARALDVLLGSPDRLARAKAASLRAAELTFCWEKQKPMLSEAVAAALSGLPASN
jgi:hypothetical protein